MQDVLVAQFSYSTKKITKLDVTIEFEIRVNHVLDFKFEIQLPCAGFGIQSSEFKLPGLAFEFKSLNAVGPARQLNSKQVMFSPQISNSFLS